ncbi:hypothetical protein ACQCVK_06520 [Rossellomorea vietnamensis]|nr:hypothetical protein [Rossellomorea aquimaris]
MADNKKTPKGTEEFEALNKANKNDRHNENAKAAADLEQEYPRINTDNI